MRLWDVVLLLAAGSAALCASAMTVAVPSEQSKSHASATLTGEPGAPPSISSQVPFETAMMQAMQRMDRDMMAAPMTGDPDHDFLAMMIPHHQGAIDMAKVILLHTKDPRIRNLAQGIITDQAYEIQLMSSWLEQAHASPPDKSHEEKAQ
jgi:uncharacterized protein (DUF305 family)